ncbi:hypothetical protein MYSTI_02458 [Myxococcus stipitatus DSM 14675]|uniref:Lipoprotein n=1 Tax=Myxococcus stipitatus (strain DSM 14675 / JCM 12634 / Mx s8) TaxID=1278073 RepID=L7UBC8_MYXSD|nr:hypothetical protein [Myxococcus stipitatus]AGC43774.1 hypothetical protein MYSTI_02458 [Myxococcus stipitatus DSM 14675]
MQAGRFISGALLAAGLVMVGCGGPVEEGLEGQELTSQEEALPNCNGLNYEYTYYSDATYTTVVGVRGCDCSYWAAWGKITSFREYVSGTCW